MLTTLISAMLLNIMASQSFLESGTAIALPTGNEIHDPLSDTYYLVFKFKGSPPYSWRHASIIITGYRHKGREGHLVKVGDAPTHFQVVALMNNSFVTQAWTGLEVVCANPNYSEWYDGTRLSEQEFRAWSPTASQTIRQQCRRKGARLPVFYQKTDIGMRWSVGNPRSNQQFMIVAFPPPPDEKTEVE